MDDGLIPAGELNPSLNDKEFRLQTLLQIKKDLSGLTEFDESFQLTSDLDPLRQIAIFLIPVLEELSKGEGSRLAQFIYRVDLSEGRFRQTMTSGNLQDLAELVVQREAFKVFLRSKYR